MFVRGWHDPSREECAFYHTMDLPDGERIDGQWDLRGRFLDYVGNEQFAGKRVLDVGCASGFLSFEAEKLGASVVSFDADSPTRIRLWPVRGAPHLTEPEEWRRSTDHYLGQLRNGYWYSHKRLSSNCAAFYGDVYNIPDYAGLYDTVIVGQILIHLQDPVEALTSIAKRCADTLIIAEGTLESDDTIAKTFARAGSGGPPYIWWLYSVPLYCEILGMLGFQVERVSKNAYHCVQHEYARGEIEITTIVARRI